MRSRSASAKAAAIVRNSLLSPLPEMSPPRSSRCRRDAALAQVLDHRERVERRAEQAVELRRDHDVALRELGEQLAALRPLGDGHGAADAFLDDDLVDVSPCMWA